MPDIFMPVDTTFSTKLHTDLIRKSVFNKYAIDYVMSERATLKEKYHDFSDFENEFVITDEMMDDFKAMAEKNGVEWNDEQYLRSEKMIKLQMKALIARNEWDMAKYYKIVSREDRVINKALEILGDTNYYRGILKR